MAHQHALKASEAAVRRYAFEEAFAWLELPELQRGCVERGEKWHADRGTVPDPRVATPTWAGQAAGDAGLGNTAR